MVAVICLVILSMATDQSSDHFPLQCGFQVQGSAFTVVVCGWTAECCRTLKRKAMTKSVTFIPQCQVSLLKKNNDNHGGSMAFRLHACM